MAITAQSERAAARAYVRVALALTPPLLPLPFRLPFRLLATRCYFFRTRSATAFSRLQYESEEALRRLRAYEAAVQRGREQQTQQTQQQQAAQQGVKRPLRKKEKRASLKLYRAAMVGTGAAAAAANLPSPSPPTVDAVALAAKVKQGEGSAAAAIAAVLAAADAQGVHTAGQAEPAAAHQRIGEMELDELFELQQREMDAAFQQHHASSSGSTAPLNAATVAPAVPAPAAPLASAAATDATDADTAEVSDPAAALPLDDAGDEDLIGELRQLVASGDMTQDDFDEAVAELGVAAAAAASVSDMGDMSAQEELGESVAGAGGGGGVVAGDLGEQLGDGALRAEMQSLLREGLMTQEEYDDAVADLGADEGGVAFAAFGAGDGGGALADSSSSSDDDDGTAAAAGGGDGDDDALVADLRELLASGDMTQEEFDQALADMGATDA